MYLSKNLTRKRIKPIVCGASFVVLLMILLLTGCPRPLPTANLNGEWKDSYGTIITINTSARTIKYMLDATNLSYEGQIVNSSDFTAENGVLIIKFTKYYDTTYDTSPPFNMTSHTENTANKGKFGALYWRDLTSISVYMADAYNGTTHVMYTTLNDAQTNFTMDKASNYINWSYTSPYTKTE
jgi:hypothetical protein